MVRQRLKLTAVSPKLLTLYEQDAMTLDMLMAFTLSNEHVRQEQVWEAIQAQHKYRISERQLVIHVSIKFASAKIVRKLCQSGNPQF